MHEYNPKDLGAQRLATWSMQQQQQQQRPFREYSPSPSLDINANITDDDLDGSSLCSSQPDDFRFYDYATPTQSQEQTPESNSSKKQRSVSWSDFPEGFEFNMLQIPPRNGFLPDVTGNNITTFKKMVKASSTSGRSVDFGMNTDDLQCFDTISTGHRKRSATVGARVSLKDLWQKIDEENTGDHTSSPDCTSWNGVDSIKPVTTWASTSSQQQKILDVERNSVACQVSPVGAVPRPLMMQHSESCRDLLQRCNSFEAMLAENGLCGPELHKMSCGVRCADIGHHPVDVSWYAARPRAHTVLSLHQDPVRTLHDVRSQKFAPKVKTWLVDCNQSKPSRVTCEEMQFSHEKCPRRLVRIENITDSSDVKYIRHRPLKPIHVVDAEYQRRKGGVFVLLYFCWLECDIGGMVWFCICDEWCCMVFILFLTDCIMCMISLYMYTVTASLINYDFAWNV